MNFPRINIHGLIGLTAIGAINFQYESMAADPHRQGEVPNVLLITVDDLNDWIGPLAGHPQTLTPNLDAFARKSLVFTNANCAAPLSNPSRTALLTGYRPGRSGVYDNNRLFRTSQVLKDIETIPQYFNKHGYFTEQKGKIFHNPTGLWADEGSWEVHVKPSGNGMNRHPAANEKMLASGIPVREGNLNNLDWGGMEVKTEESSDYQAALWAAGELAKEHDRPFFIGCGIFRPHLPWYVPQKYFDRFPVETIRNTYIDENDLDDIPDAGKKISGGLKPDSDYNTLKKLGLTTEATRAYLACIAYADECIGVVLDALEKSKYWENTIVIIIGDHGWHLGEKLHYKKFTLWEESARAPMIWRVPGVTPEGKKCTRTVDFMSIYPTLVSLCKLPVKSDIEGHDITPLLKDPGKKWEHPAICTMGQNNHTVRTERWRYIRYADGSEELYDHSKDEYEIKNLAGDPSYSGVIKDLKKWLPKENAEPIPVYKKEEAED